MNSSKSLLLAALIALLHFYPETNSQRVAPGVPPQHYQNPNPQHFDPNQQQFQHVPQHQQQHQQQQQFQQPLPPQQYAQQPPPPQQQQQQHFQQQPQQGHAPQVQQAGHGHGHAPHHGQGQPILDASNVLKEREHIGQHMDVPIDTSQMSEQELQFHYFKMHDSDNNNKLDGCELVKSLIHWHDASNHDHRGGQPVPEAKIFNDEELINMIDPILANDDKNGDGFIDYGEFSLAQASAAQRPKTP